MKTIYLICHAEADVKDGQRFCLGQMLDWPLTDHGIQQAQELHRVFSDIHLDAVYTSPLKRARQTGEILADGRCPVVSVKGLEEMHSGEWEGLPFPEIHVRYAALWRAREMDRSLPPPGGETYDAANKRMMCALLGILKNLPEGCVVAVVAHSSVNRALLCPLLDIPYRQNMKISQLNCGTVMLQADERGLHVGKHL